MGSNSHLFDRKPISETIAGRISRDYASKHRSNKTFKARKVPQDKEKIQKEFSSTIGALDLK